MDSAKYIVDETGNMVVFSDVISHASFKHRHPKSAGFVCFSVNKLGNPVCHCYGRSESLDIGSDHEDTRVAMRQILGYEWFEIDDNLR
jgi:hypothetical protein